MPNHPVCQRQAVVNMPHAQFPVAVCPEHHPLPLQGMLAGRPVPWGIDIHCFFLPDFIDENRSPDPVPGSNAASLGNQESSCFYVMGRKALAVFSLLIIWEILLPFLSPGQVGLVRSADISVLAALLEFLQRAG